MTLVIFGIGAFVFFLTVYGTVVAGGLRLTVRQLDEESELAQAAGVADKRARGDLSVADTTSTEF